MTTVLRLEDVTVAVGGHVLVRELRTEVPAGRVLAVTGPPASGKSLLLQTVAAERAPASGRVMLGKRRTSDPVVQTQTGYLAQTIQVLDALTAVENVALPLLARSAPAAQAWTRAEEQLGRLDLNVALWHNLAEQLSGGQRQRVAFARATVHRPQLLVADDPTSELDSASAELVVSVMRDLAGAGSVIVLATSDPELAGRADLRLDLGDLVGIAAPPAAL
jgi:putative ABC transport system ATP-binding protein